MIQMEVCANGLASARAAQKGGAVRVELCDNLLEGGTTPSYAQIKLARQMLHIKLYVIIRPRGGNFVYSDLEFELMKIDIGVCKSLNCDGVVFGILNKNGQVDVERCKHLMALAKPMKVTFHRAFDRAANLNQALDDVIALGCERILTSGGQPTALAGAEKIKSLIERAGGRIIIMPGAGIRIDNIAEVIRITGANEFHASAKSVVESAKNFNLRSKISDEAEKDSFFELTDAVVVQQLIHQANGKSV